MIWRSPLLGPRIARKAFLFSLSLVVAWIGLLSGTVLRGRAFGPMPLGNYIDTTVQLGANTTITPDAAPTNTTSLNVSTSTNFKGRLEGSPTTGIVRVTNAHPAGTYTVIVTAFDGVPTTKTFTLTVTTPVTCNPVSFAAATNFGVASHPFSVAVGDFNRDGKQDLATTSSAGDGVSVLLGNGAGGFSASNDFVVGAVPRSVAVGDFDGDDKQDLAVANQGSDNVSVLLGDGGGGFGAATNFGVGTGPFSVAVGDFNGDSRQDLATANVNSDNVSVLLGNGAGGFGAATNFGVGTGPGSVAVGDFNGDNKQDLATANSNSANVSVLLGNGAGSFGAATNFGVGSSPFSLVVGDFNGDGKQDLATANQDSNNASVLLGDGAGSFSAATNFGVGSTPRTVAVGDFDGNGKQDLAVANLFSNNVSVLLGDGGGGFGAATNLAVGAETASVAVGDFNGDGKQDLATANSSSSSVSVLLRQCAQPPLVSLSGRIADGAGQSLPGVTVTVSGNASSSTTTDANGNYSFTSLAAGGNYTITPSSNSHSFSPPSQTFNNLSVNRIAHFVATQTVVSITGQVTNANNVGISNVTVALTKNGAPNGTAVTDNLGNYGFGSLAAGANYVVTPVGSFSPSRQSFTSLAVNVVANFTASPSIPPQCNTSGFAPATNFAAASGSRAVAIGDFNNDGKSDLAVANGTSGNVSILLGSGTGSFGAATNFAAGSVPESVAVGDFNIDGNSDLAVANQVSGNVSILLGSGTGSFSAATNFAVGSVPLSVAIGDFNSDGKSDLVVANRSSNNVSILLGSGTGSFGAATNFPLGQGPRFVAIGDFNGDGKSDLATPNQFSNDVSILLGSGTGSFSAATNFPVGLFPISVAIGDFNGDGKSDLATANVNSDNVSILLGSGTGSFSAATNLTAGSVPESVVIGDFNGDGKSDLAVANVNSDNVSILLGSGTGSFSAATNFAVGSFPRTAAIGDFNGDGKSDLATANNNSNNVSILLNNSATCNTQASLTISGRIANASNIALSDVAVTLSGPITRVVQTDLNGNYSFPNLVPGGNYSVTVQSSHFVFAASRTDFSSLSGNQTADFTVVPLVVPSPSPPPSDDFNSPTRDPNKWNLGTQTQPASAFDPQITVAQINGQLVITPLAQVSGLHYNGYVSANSFDMRGGSVSVELVQAGAGGADSIFAIGSDADNFYRFMVHTAGPATSLAPTARGRDGIERPLDLTVPQLLFQIRVGGVLTALSIPYDPMQHRFMRFRHDAMANAIVFETSPNPFDFIEQHRVVLVRSVSALTAELSAGTSNPTNPGATVFDNFGLVTSTFQFSSASYTVDEGGGSIQITVTRAGSTAGTAAVDYATADGTALQTTKYINAAGRLMFAPGEASKTFRVLIVDNAQAEGNQNLNLLLQEPAASGLNTPGRAVLNIIDNDTTVATSNPLDEPTFYVQQHYYDFLNRPPDPAGLAFWVDQITSCGSDAQCVEIRRINVSAAYFLSIEFQETGFLVHRFYNLALNRANGLPRYLEFLRDTQAIGRGVVVGDPGYEALLEANKVAYANEFAARAEFTTIYPLTQTPEQHVDALYAHAGITPSAAERQAAIDEFINPTGARGRVLRRIAENQMLRTREFNRAFVLAQYFGYLRRNPDDAPDNNLDGYNFWLGKLNQFNGDFVAAEMVKAFITSGEYRQRFGP